MEKTFINSSRQLLRVLYRQHEQLNKEFSQVQGSEHTRLHKVQPQGINHSYYLLVTRQVPQCPDDENDAGPSTVRFVKQYLGNESNEEVLKIKKAHYLAKALDVVDRDIELLENLTEKYRPTDFEGINQMLPKTYRLDTSTPSPDINPAVQKWLNDKTSEKESYGPWYPEGLIHRVSNGIYVRTKSEMAIAEILLRNEIPFIYELPHRLKNGSVVHTDFTMLSTIDYKTEKLLEHEGSMQEPKYRKKHSWRVENYYESGYIPNVNLFFTFDGLNGSIDGESIQRIIDGWLKPVS